LIVPSFVDAPMRVRSGWKTIVSRRRADAWPWSDFRDRSGALVFSPGCMLPPVL